MNLSDGRERELSPTDMAALIEELRSATRRLSRDQILDLADSLHDVIRERQFEARSWRRVQDRSEMARG
jgi:hypothetical protein